MALDETLLLSCERGMSPPTLRFYSWYPFSVSVGYSKGIEDIIDVEEAKELHVPVVRRPTGGGALFHYDDISYAFVFGRYQVKLSTPLKTYEVLHKAFADSLECIGLNACLREKDDVSAVSDLCFASHTRSELLIDGKKSICSAQRRLKNTFLQHGSIFLHKPADKYLRVFNGIEGKDFFSEIFWLGEHIDRYSLKRLLNGFIYSISGILDVSFFISSLTPFERKIMEGLLKDKYLDENRNVIGKEGYSEMFVSF